MNKKHPSAWDPAIMLLNILVSVIGSIIGLELIARLGISTNTSIIGALFAIIISRNIKILIPRTLSRQLCQVQRSLLQTVFSYPSVFLIC
jgi:uncharacterized oligopeptide transporter (OPT) family protein